MANTVPAVTGDFLPDVHMTTDGMTSAESVHSFWRGSDDREALKDK
jgi:hypothetical protein